MKEVRQVNLPKASKIDRARNTMEAAGARPICVESVWWRIWNTAWATGSTVQKWREMHLPKQVLGGKKSKGAEEGAADAFDDLMLLGFSGTLDYTACYDMMAPDQTCELLRQVGWPSDLVDLLEDTWTNMQRWVSYEGHTDEETLHAGLAMAQGDPWGPIMLNIWMAAGYWWTERERKNEEQSCTGPRKRRVVDEE
eukprot:2828470-Karenia_brevis.AAC.1